ncbi:DUF4102 domain-containing protein [Burkholderia metallica]|uniref:DUF4102 domain-containing protein n=1 Tax=Burkholderia metallica TaxID=488729 RepID=UPI0038500047
MRVIKRVSFRSAEDDTCFLTVPFDDVKIRQAKVDDKPIKLVDFDGLDLWVKPSGSRLWRHKYRTGPVGAYQRRQRNFSSTRRRVAEEEADDVDRAALRRESAHARSRCVSVGNAPCARSPHTICLL